MSWLQWALGLLYFIFLRIFRWKGSRVQWTFPGGKFPGLGEEWESLLRLTWQEEADLRVKIPLPMDKCEKDNKGREDYSRWDQGALSVEAPLKWSPEWWEGTSYGDFRERGSQSESKMLRSGRWIGASQGKGRAGGRQGTWGRKTCVICRTRMSLDPMEVFPTDSYDVIWFYASVVSHLVT